MSLTREGGVAGGNLLAKFQVPLIHIWRPLYLVTEHTANYTCRLEKKLGSGQFGEVYKGVWARAEDELDVAVKTLKEDSGEEERLKFLQEAAIMAQFKHSNIVSTYGVISDGQPVR